MSWKRLLIGQVKERLLFRPYLIPIYYLALAQKGKTKHPSKRRAQRATFDHHQIMHLHSSSSGVGDGWAGWAITYPGFGRSVHQSEGADCTPPQQTLLLVHPDFGSFLRPYFFSSADQFQSWISFNWYFTTSTRHTLWQKWTSMDLNMTFGSIGLNKNCYINRFQQKK